MVVKYKNGTVKVDKDGYNLLMSRNWNYNKTNIGAYYLARGQWEDGKTKKVLFHRELMGVSKGEYIDHMNGNTLDNRKENLRVCTNQENSWNSRKTKSKTSSVYKGVSYDKERGLWSAFITLNRKHIYLGRYKKEDDAAKAYDDAALKYFGAYANLNFEAVVI